MRRSCPLLMTLLAACGGGPDAGPAGGARAGAGATGDGLPGASQDDVGTVEVPDREDARARQLKRMTVSQVRDSMERVTGGVTWGGEQTSDWDRNAGTLGVADFQLRVEDDRSPSVMFQKFLDDAATETCAQWVRGAGTVSFFDGPVPDPTDRDALAAQAAHLRWTVQGRPLDDDAEVVDDLVDLCVTVQARTADPEAAWQTVCVAVFTHPDFFMY